MLTEETLVEQIKADPEMMTVLANNKVIRAVTTSRNRSQCS